MRKLRNGMGLAAGVALAGALVAGAAGLALAQEPGISFAADTLPASSQAASTGAPSTAAPDTGTSPTATKAVTITLTQDDEKLVVPYGVNPVDWLGTHLTFDVKVTETDGTVTTTQNQKAADIEQYFEDGKVIVEAQPATGETTVPYPANQVEQDGTVSAPDWSKSVAFGTAVGDGSVIVTLPAVTDLKAQMSWTNKDADSAAEIPVAPEDVVSSLTQELANAQGTKVVPTVTGTFKTNDVILWLDGADLATGATPVTLSVPDQSKLRLSDTFDVNDKGEFASASTPAGDTNPVLNGGTGLKVDGTTGAFYVRLAEDVPNPDDAEHPFYYAGQVVRVPALVDTQAPEASELTVIDAAGTSYDAAALQAKATDGRVVTPADGLSIRVKVADPAAPTPDPNAPAGTVQDTAASTVADSVKLTVGSGDAAKVLPGTVEADGTVTFKLDAQTVGQGAIPVTDLHLSVADKAGNVFDTTLDRVDGALKAGDPAAVTTLAIYDPADPANADAGAVVVNGVAYGVPAADAQTEPVVTSTDLAAQLRLKAADAMGLGGLLAPKSYTHTVETAKADGTGTETLADTDQDAPLTQDDFTGIDSTYNGLDLSENLTTEGLHAFTFTYGGSTSFLTPLADATAKATVVLDKTAPAATDAQHVGENDEGQTVVTDSKHDGTYAMGGVRTVTVSVQDLLAGAVDAPADVSGVDWGQLTATVTSYSTQYVEQGSSETLTAEDPAQNADAKLTYDAAAGTVTLKLDEDGFYPLDQIVFHLVDKAGNATGGATGPANVTLADLANLADLPHASEWKTADGNPIAGFIVVAEESPAAHVEVNGEDDKDVDAKEPYQVAPEVRVRLDSPIFGLLKGTGKPLSDYLDFTGTLTPGDGDAASAAIEALDFDDFELQDNGTWLATVTLPADTEGNVLEGSYDISVSYHPMGAEAGKPTTESRATFVYDKTAPAATGATLATEFDKATDVATLEGTKHDGSYAVGGARTVTVDIRDLLRGTIDDVEDVSGLDATQMSATLVRYAGPNATDATRTELAADQLTYDAAKQTVTLSFADTGIYPLDEAELRLVDKAGTAQTYKLSDVVDATVTDNGANAAAWQNADGAAVDGFVVSDPDTSSASVTVTVDGTEDSDPDIEVEAYQHTPDVRVLVADPLFAVYQTLPDFKPAEYLTLAGTITPGEGVAVSQTFGAATLADSAEATDQEDTWSVAVSLPTKTDGTDAIDGTYSITVDYTPRGGAKTDPRMVQFLVDSTAPVVTDARIDGQVDAAEVSDMGDEGSYLYGGERTIKVRVQDLLRGTGTADGMNAERTSGVNTSTIAITGTRSDGSETDAGAPVTFVEAGKAQVAADGTLSFTIADEGLYKLDGIHVTFSDAAGNQYDKTLAEVIASKEDISKAWTFGGASDPISAIYVASDEPLPADKLTIAVTDADGHQVNTDDWNNVHGPLTFTVTVNDPRFRVWSNLSADDDFLKVTLTPGSGSVDAESQNLAPADLVHKMENHEANIWTYSFTLPEQGQGDATEGTYQVELNYGYVKVAGKLLLNQQRTTTFGVDFTEPTVTDVALADANKVENVDATTGTSRDVAKMDDGSYVIGGERAITIDVRDFLRGYEGTTDGATEGNGATGGNGSTEGGATEGNNGSTEGGETTGNGGTSGGQAGGVTPQATEANASGVDWDSLKVTLVPETDANGTEGEPVELTLGSGLTRTGSKVTIPLAGEGLYRLSKVTVDVSDTVGNTYNNTLDKVIEDRNLTDAWSFGGTESVKGILVDTTAPAGDDLVLTVQKASEDVPDSTLEGFFRGNVLATVTVHDPWFGFWLHSARSKTLVTASLTPGSASLTAAPEAITVDPNDGTDVNGDGTTWAFDVSQDFPATDGNQVEGAYALKATYQGAGDASQEPVSGEYYFHIDRTSPSFVGTKLLEPVDTNRDVADMGDGRVNVIGGTRSLNITVRDLLRGMAPSNGDTSASQPETAGIAVNDFMTDAITVTLGRRSTLDDNAEMEQIVVGGDEGLPISSDGTVNIPLNVGGYYRIADIQVSVKDAAGNEQSKPLSDIIASLPAADQTYWQFGTGKVATGIIVDDESSTKPEVGLDATDGTDDDGNPIPPSDSPYYHRGDTIVEVWVRDPWFDAYRHSGRGTSFSTVSLVRAGSSDPESLAPMDLNGMTYDAEQDRWEQVYALPRVKADSKLPVEGDYSFQISYEGLNGTPENPEVEPQSVGFGVDYTSPTFGNVNLSEVAPTQWGWILPGGDETVSADVADNLSGLRGDTAMVEPNGNVTNDDLATTYADREQDQAGRTIAGALQFTLSGDGDRIYFQGTKLHIKDAAGNDAAVDMGQFVGRDSNIPGTWGDEYDPKPYQGISVDLLAPTIDVAFDNNDVHNEQYYNQDRNATVTIAESNFDLIKANDKDRVVATVGQDGQEGEQLSAEAFTNPSGDGRTWVATHTFENDADYTFDVSLTDPAGHEAEAYHTAFILDKTAPAIMVQWDNNEVEGGMYYKATRTASISVSERNFSPELASVTTTAADASGASVEAPGDSGWVEAKPREEWTNGVYFGNELHYTMKVAVTDLAGNTAEEYDEPEFVIDMTAPVVEVGGVEDKHAYADEVKPTIHYSDTNFEPAMATYTIAGGRRGDKIYFDTEDQETDTTKDTTFADFEHTMENDDVYTLVATISDKAGNTAEQTVTFSVNRFGSNYVMLSGSGTVLGTYLNKPQDIVVAEINASGLDESKGRAELTHDTEVSTLSADSDYTVQTGSEDDAWNMTTYTFPSKLFKDDGYYRIILTSTDLAGNLSQNTMNEKNQTRDGSAAIDFAVDGTAPRAELMGITSNSVYLDPNKQVSVAVQDNLLVESAALSVDGNEIASWDEETLSGDDLRQTLFSAGMPVDDQAHDVELVVTDKAGNQTRVSATGVLVTGDLVTYVLNTPSVLYAVIAGAVALVLAAGVVIFLAVRHHRLTEAKRNPFGHTNPGASK